MEIKLNFDTFREVFFLYYLYLKQVKIKSFSKTASKQYQLVKCYGNSCPISERSCHTNK